MKSIEVRITGISPLLMHRYPAIAIESLEKKPIEEQAELCAYRDEASGGLYVPGNALMRALVNGAAYSKGKGRASLAKVASAGIFVSPEYLDLGVSKYEIDARSVVIPATRGRVMRYRPKLSTWSVGFTLEYDETLMTPEQVRRIVDDTGQRVGLLEFRPEKKGPFGRFVVTSWQ
jgi:hypothetical protein